MEKEEILIKVDNIKKILNLNNTTWKDIDPYLLLLAFTHSSGVQKIPQYIRNYQNDEYGFLNYDFYEVSGDRVLDMVIINILMQLKYIETVGDIVYIKEEVVRNSTLYCYMSKKGLCSEIIKSGEGMASKICSDVFEAILGVLYHWGYYIKGMKYNVLEEIQKWLMDNWNVQETIINLLDYGETLCGTTDSVDKKSRGRITIKTSNKKQYQKK